MKGPLDVVGALCTAQCAKYFKRFTKTVNSTETLNSNKNEAFERWMEG